MDERPQLRCFVSHRQKYSPIPFALIRSDRDTKQKSEEVPDVRFKPEAQKSNYLAYFAQTYVPSQRSVNILHAVNASLISKRCQAF